MRWLLQRAPPTHPSTAHSALCSALQAGLPPAAPGQRALEVEVAVQRVLAQVQQQRIRRSLQLQVNAPPQLRHPPIRLAADLPDRRH